MIYINLGFPKTSTTNLQSNIYPNLDDIKYFGKFYINRSVYQDELFNKFNSYVENRKIFSNLEFKNLVDEFKNYSIKYNKILISQESWVYSYQKNNLTRKWEIIPKDIKLKNLLLLLDQIDTPYKFFITQRDLKTSIKSIHVQSRDAIRELFGEKFLDINYFLNKIHKKEDDYKDLLLNLTTFNLKDIKKIIPENKITIFNYDDISNNPKKFLQHLFNFLEIKPDYSLTKRLLLKERVTKRNKNFYHFTRKNFLFILIKFITPKVLVKKMKFLSKNIFISFFLFKKTYVNPDENLLDDIIQEYF